MEKKHLRVLSYNIHKGFNRGNRELVLGRIRDAIREVHADLVFLQEVQGQHDEHEKNHEKWPKEPQFEFLADELWPHFAYGKNAVYTSGHHGNAILSKYPFAFTENIDVSTSKYERRGLLHGVIEIPGRKLPFHAICVHLGLFENDRQSQLKRICERIESHVKHAEPLVIAGDFNDWMGRASSPLYGALEVKEAFREAGGAHARTFPSWLPALRLDRIYYRGLKLEKARVLSGAPWSRLSDHAALYAELGL
jgi:endonuclease/exonuclease/phosphatase family metal-dependent hydrolase